MKFLISILITLIISMGIGVKYFFDKSMLFDTKLKKLQHKNKNLTANNSKLKKSKKQLIAKQRTIHKRMKTQRKKFTKKLLLRTEAKLASAPTKAVPLIGIPIIIGMTANDINAYCEDIKVMKEFENSLFGVVENNTTIEEEKICGMNVEKELKPIVEKQYYDSLNWVEKSSKDAMKNIQNKYNESKTYFQELIK